MVGSESQTWMERWNKIPLEEFQTEQNICLVLQSVLGFQVCQVLMNFNWKLTKSSTTYEIFMSTQTMVTSLYRNGVNSVDVPLNFELSNHAALGFRI